MKNLTKTIFINFVFLAAIIMATSASANILCKPYVRTITLDCMTATKIANGDGSYYYKGNTDTPVKHTVNLVYHIAAPICKIEDDNISLNSVMAACQITHDQTQKIYFINVPYGFDGKSDKLYNHMYCRIDGTWNTSGCPHITW